MNLGQRHTLTEGHREMWARLSSAQQRLTTVSNKKSLPRNLCPAVLSVIIIIFILIIAQ